MDVLTLIVLSLSTNCSIAMSMSHHPCFSSPLKADINMTGIVEVSSNVPNATTLAEWPGIVSRFQLVILAAHRNKQLLRGAQPRIATDRLKRRNTSIALEELKRGLILFKPVAVEEAQSMA
jgi:DNA-directed RNA polymerase omega subunit